MGGIASASVLLQATRCFEDEDRLDGVGYSSAFGSLDDSDQEISGAYVDNFSFDALAGDEMAFHVFSDEVDARFDLYDPSCERVLTVEDGGRGTNPFASTTLPESGTWTLVVSAPEGSTGSFLVERIDDSTPVGTACGRETPTMNLLDAPYTDSHSGSLEPSDQQWGPNVGNNFYFDDIEFYSLYGDEVTLVHESTAYTPTLSFFFFDPETGSCGIETYDANDDVDSVASTTATINRTGIYAAIPWARFSGSTGPYTVTGTTSF